MSAYRSAKGDGQDADDTGDTDEERPDESWIKECSIEATKSISEPSNASVPGALATPLPPKGTVAVVV